MWQQNRHLLRGRLNNQLVIQELLTVKVLVADNSNNKDEIARACESDHKISVVAKVHSGLDIISYSTKAHIDVVVTTTNLPDMHLDKVIHRLYSKKIIPVLILKETNDSHTYAKEFNIGIIDRILVNFKNNKIQINEASMTTRIQILSKLKLGKFDSRVRKITDAMRKPRQQAGSLMKKLVRSDSEVNDQTLSITELPRNKKIVIIGASTGGPKLLSKIIPKFPINIPPVIVIQHIPTGFIEGFAKRMNKHSKVKVKMATNGDTLQSGTVYVAPGGYHLKLISRGVMMPKIEIFDDEPVNFVKPSVDVTLLSAANCAGLNVISIILTGMGVDGLKGSKQVKQKGGSVLALNEADSDIYGMNKAVIEAGIVDKILPASGIVRGMLDVIRGR